MKQLLVIAIALTSVNAFATRARVQALGNSVHLVDTQSVYNRPTDIFELGSDYVTLETGVTGTAAGLPTAGTSENANAEGMIVRTMGDTKMGLSLGHQSKNASSWGLRKAATAAGLNVNQQNPIEFTYGMKSGDMNFVGTLVYSSYNNKTVGAAVQKENSTGFRLGAASGAWEASLGFGLINTVESSTNKFTGTSALSLKGGYKLDTMYFFADLDTAAAKLEAGSTELGKLTTQDFKVGVVNSHKKDGNELFYSVALNQTEHKEDTTKDTSLTLPIAIGMEVDANSWLTLRGSVSQSTLINNTKNESAPASEFAPAANSTTVAAGAGLKFNKLNVDGTISTATTQKVNTTDLLAQVGMTYWF